MMRVRIEKRGGSLVLPLTDELVADAELAAGMEVDVIAGFRRIIVSHPRPDGFTFEEICAKLAEGEPPGEFQWGMLLDQMSIEERVQLAETCWDTVADEVNANPGLLPLTDAERALIHSRREAFERDPDSAVPLEVAMERIEKVLADLSRDPDGDQPPGSTPR